MCLSSHPCDVCTLVSCCVQYFLVLTAFDVSCDSEFTEDRSALIITCSTAEGSQTISGVEYSLNEGASVAGKSRYLLCIPHSIRMTILSTWENVLPSIYLS